MADDDKWFLRLARDLCCFDQIGNDWGKQPLTRALCTGYLALSQIHKDIAEKEGSTVAVAFGALTAEPHRSSHCRSNHRAR